MSLLLSGNVFYCPMLYGDVRRFSKGICVLFMDVFEVRMHLRCKGVFRPCIERQTFYIGKAPIKIPKPACVPTVSDDHPVAI